MSFLLLLIVVPSAVWVYRDASRRDWNGSRLADKPWQWAVAVFFLWIIAMPLYLYSRRKRPLLSVV